MNTPQNQNFRHLSMEQLSTASTSSDDQNSIKCYFMRHAESKFNQVMHNCAYQSLSPEAKDIYQLNAGLIDCEITQKGIQQIQSINFSDNKFQEQASTNIKFDIIFVSPLGRALETARKIIECQNIKYKKVIVIPQLTEVVSKVCDFSHDVEEKIQKYNEFDFYLFKNKNTDQVTKPTLNFWQDQLVDEQYQTQIDTNKQNGERYIGILDRIFPSALESPERCLQRTMKVIEKIKDISRQEKAKNVLVVTHNRILKNIFTSGDKQKLQHFKIFSNCQIRSLVI